MASVRIKPLASRRRSIPTLSLYLRLTASGGAGAGFRRSLREMPTTYLHVSQKSMCVIHRGEQSIQQVNSRLSLAGSLWPARSFAIARALLHWLLFFHITGSLGFIPSLTRLKANEPRLKRALRIVFYFPFQATELPHRERSCVVAGSAR